jgi:hypothetical protein
MKKALSFLLISSIFATVILSSCSSGASNQSWHPKTGKKPKAGHNR